MGKSERAFASTQTFSAIELARAISARSSEGTRRALSQSRATTLTRSASIDSPGGGSPSSSDRARSIRAPTSSAMNISWRTRARVASVSARAWAPPLGIIVRSSHASREAALLTSLISPSRSRSSSMEAMPINLRRRGRPLGRDPGEALEPALVETDHHRPQHRLHGDDAPAPLGLLGADEGAALLPAQDPTVVAAAPEHLGVPADPLGRLVLDHLGGDKCAEAPPPEPAAQLEPRPRPVQVPDELCVRVVRGPEVRPADPGPDRPRVRPHLELVDGVERRALGRVLVGPADHGSAVAQRADDTP